MKSANATKLYRKSGGAQRSGGTCCFSSGSHAHIEGRTLQENEFFRSLLERAVGVECFVGELLQEIGPRSQ